MQFTINSTVRKLEPKHPMEEEGGEGIQLVEEENQKDLSNEILEEGVIERKSATQVVYKRKLYAL